MYCTGSDVDHLATDILRDPQANGCDKLSFVLKLTLKCTQKHQTRQTLHKNCSMEQFLAVYKSVDAKQRNRFRMFEKTFTNPLRYCSQIAAEQFLNVYYSNC